MTHKVITLEFVVPTVAAIALGFVLSIGAIHLTDKYLGPIEPAEIHLPVAKGRVNLRVSRRLGVPAFAGTTASVELRLVWWFRSSHHCWGESLMRTSEPKPH